MVNRYFPYSCAVMSYTNYTGDMLLNAVREWNVRSWWHCDRRWLVYGWWYACSDRGGHADAGQADRDSVTGAVWLSGDKHRRCSLCTDYRHCSAGRTTSTSVNARRTGSHQDQHQPLRSDTGIRRFGPYLPLWLRAVVVVVVLMVIVVIVHCRKKVTPEYRTMKMSNLNESEWNFVHLMPNKLLKWAVNFVGKYYFLADLLIVQYR